MSLALIGLGSNLGDRRRTLAEAVGRVGHQSGVRLSAASRWYQTRPVGGPADQRAYLNGAALLETSLPPEELLARLLEVERQLGRRRDRRWQPRTVDLDLLLYDRLVIDRPGLAVPHPRMAWRRFVLEPAAEIAPSLVHPTTGWTIARLLEHLNTARDYLAMAGPPGAGKTQLAQRVAANTSAELLLRPVQPPPATPPEDDSPGSLWARQIQLLRQWSHLLADQEDPWTRPQATVVSDFWFDQCRAYAAVSLPGAELEAFGRQWEAARQWVVQPKLVVLLDPPSEAAPEPVDSGGAIPSGPSRLREAIRREAAQPGKGPVMRLAGAELADAEAEVLAALESMR